MGAQVSKPAVSLSKQPDIASTSWEKVSLPAETRVDREDKGDSAILLDQDVSLNALSAWDDSLDKVRISSIVIDPGIYRWNRSQAGD